MKTACSLLLITGLGSMVLADIQDTPVQADVPKLANNSLEGLHMEALLPLMQVMMSGDEAQKAQLPMMIAAALMQQGKIGSVDVGELGQGMNEMLPLIQLLMTMEGGPQNSALLAQVKTLFAGKNQNDPAAQGNVAQGAPVAAPVHKPGAAIAEAMALMSAFKGAKYMAKAFEPEEAPPMRVLPGAVAPEPNNILQLPVAPAAGPIATVFQKDGWITVYDVAGQVMSRQNTNGKLLEHTANSYSVEEAGTVATYDAQGQLINRKAKQ